MKAKLSLANLPTRIQHLSRWSAECGKNIYVKRDDQTGSEWSGNKIRKLEFAVAEALAQGCNLLITCGGIQSNHCRATVSVATYLGMRSAGLLRISEEPPLDGNYFLDRLMGADVRFCTRDEYRDHRAEIMQEMADGYAAQGFKPYIIPEGASFGVGTLGYYFAMKEIVAQEREMGITFDTVVVATGSGGTLAGLQLANLLRDKPFFLLLSHLLAYVLLNANHHVLVFLSNLHQADQTFRKGVNRFEDFISLCQVRGWLVERLDVHTRLDIYAKAEEEVHFE